MQPTSTKVQQACDNVVRVLFTKITRIIQIQMIRLGEDSIRLTGKVTNVYYQGALFYRFDENAHSAQLHRTLKKKGDYLLFQIKKIEEDSTRIEQLFVRLCVLKDYATIRVLLTDNLINAMEDISTETKQTLLALPAPTDPVEHTESQTILYYYVKSLS